MVIYLGDYVDRGLHSKEVIDLLLDQPLKDFEQVYLKGNHEEAFLNFLEDETIGSGWFSIGGDATVYSYGVRSNGDIPLDSRNATIKDELSAAVPARHLDFLSRLVISREVGDFLFVHAGVRPRRPLDQQTPQDLLWIRDEFLLSTVDHGKIIVHGHCVTPEPDVRKNRIGIDTGAYVSGNLTCLVLEGTSRRFLSTVGQTNAGLNA